MDESEVMKGNLLVWLLLVAVVTGCHEDRSVDGFPGVEEVCIKGVVYYKDYHRLAPALMPSGRPYLCPGKS